MHHDRPRQENPLVTVLMPAHNEEEFISEAIESVLAQSYENFELLVLDDASQDETQRIVDSFIDPRIRRHRNIRNLGVSRTLNLGFDLARGKYVAVLGGDDRMVTTRLSKQVSLLESDPTLIACGSWYLRFGYQNYVEETPVGREAVRDGFLLFPSVGGGVVMYNADKLRSSGERYDPHYVAAQDYDFHSRLLPYGDMENIPEALYHYRISGAQTSFVTGKSGRLEENPMVRGYAMEIQRRNLRRAAGGTEIEDDILEVLGRWRQPSSPMELVEMVPRVHHLISQIDAVGVNGGEVIESRFRAVCSQYLTSYESPGPRHLKLMLRLREHLDLRARDWAKQCVRNLLGLTAQRRRTIRGRLLHRTRRIPDVGNA